MDVLPYRTERILKLIYENGNKFNVHSFRTMSEDPNWERIQTLEVMGYVLTQPAEMGPPTYFISPLGEVYLQDVKELRKEKWIHWLIDKSIAIFALVVSLISLFISLYNTFIPTASP